MVNLIHCYSLSILMESIHSPLLLPSPCEQKENTLQDFHCSCLLSASVRGCQCECPSVGRCACVRVLHMLLCGCACLGLHKCMCVCVLCACWCDTQRSLSDASLPWLHIRNTCTVSPQGARQTAADWQQQRDRSEERKTKERAERQKKERMEK